MRKHRKRVKVCVGLCGYILKENHRRMSRVKAFGRVKAAGSRRSTRLTAAFHMLIKARFKDAI